MGANATGKTSLGKALLRIFGYMTNGNPTALYEMVADDKGYFSIVMFFCVSIWRRAYIRFLLFLHRMY